MLKQIYRIPLALFVLTLSFTSASIVDSKLENKCNAIYGSKLNQMAKYLLIDSRDNKAITDVRTSTKYTYASIAYYKGAKTPYLGIPITTSRISNFQEYLNIKYGSGSQVSEFINLGGFDDSLPSRAILVVYKVRTNIPFALDLVKQINSETILRCSFAVFLTINDDF